MISRRSFFATLLAPIATRFIPRNALLDTINDGINPDWDGAFRPKLYSVDTRLELDDINVTTLNVLRESPLLDIVFMQSPFSVLMMKKERIIDAGGRVVGQFGRIPGEPWKRLSGGLRHPLTVPRLPA